MDLYQHNHEKKHQTPRGNCVHRPDDRRASCGRRHQPGLFGRLLPAGKTTKTEEATQEPTTEPLVTKAASDGLFVRYDSVDKEKGRITYKGLGIYKNVDDEKSILKKRDFSINTF